MGGRYSDIYRGAALEQARQNLEAHRAAAATRTPNIGGGTPRDLDAILYLQPFTVDVAVDEVVSAKAYNSGFDTLGTYINASSVAAAQTTLGANSIIKLPKFRAARIRWERAATKQLVSRTAEATRTVYGAYSNLDRFSCPFGATADTDDMISSFLDVQAAILAVTGFEVSRVNLSREFVGIEAI